MILTVLMKKMQTIKKSLFYFAHYDFINCFRIFEQLYKNKSK